MSIDNEYLIFKTFLNAGKELRPSEIMEFCGRKLSEPTLHKHLKKLCDRKYLIRKESRKKREYPHPVFYSTSKNIKDFLIIAAEFKDKPEWLDFHTSLYCKNMITPPLVRVIEKLWNIEPLPSKTVSDNPDVFTEEDVLEILNLSPTALQKTLSDPLEDTSSESFKDMLLSSLILDINTRFYQGCKFEVEMSVKILRSGKEAFFKRHTSSVFTMMPNEYLD